LWNASPAGIVPPPDLEPRAPTVPDSKLDNPKHWQERAEEARSIAEQLKDPDSRPMLLRIADDYERLGEHARRRMKGPAAAS